MSVVLHNPNNKDLVLGWAEGKEWAYRGLKELCVDGLLFDKWSTVTLFKDSDGETNALDMIMTIDSFTDNMKAATNHFDDEDFLTHFGKAGDTLEELDTVERTMFTEKNRALLQKSLDDASGVDVNFLRNYHVDQKTLLSSLLNPTDGMFSCGSTMNLA